MTFADLQRTPSFQVEPIPHMVSARYGAKSIREQVMEQLSPAPDGYRVRLLYSETIEQLNHKLVDFFLEYKRGRYWGHQLSYDGKLIQPVIVPL